MQEIFKIASRISTPIAAATFALACVLWVIDRTLRQRGKVGDTAQQLLRLAVYGFFAVSLVSVVGDIYLKHQANTNAVYRVRVTVLGPSHTPIENATVWISAGGEPKRVSGGWEFDIPAGNKPLDGEITLYAKVVNTSLQGSANLRLETDHNPSISVILAPNESAMVRGTVEDDAGDAIGEVEVSVVGYGDERVTTSASGTFALRAHVADGQTVRLHAEAHDFQPLDQDHPAGTSPAILVLHRRHAHP